MIDYVEWCSNNRFFGPDTGIVHFDGDDSDEETIEAIQEWARIIPGVTTKVEQVAPRKGVSVIVIGISCENFSHLYDNTKK